MPPLVPCIECRRHIRVDHASCPFCAAIVPDDFARGIVPAARRRLDRLATFSFATTLAVAACGDTEPSPNLGTDAGTVTDAGVTDSGFDGDSGGVGTKYGMPPIDSGFDGDSGSVGAKYGLPPIDAGDD
jgi:hypothetical protein